ncbi:MAG TPA: CopD family protein [Vitreimonas sp.]|uniref:CopD family protein n=1 Tax=Vitreimonas sp. TaxID=3069702 RepID=UPI002D256F46|nr:CopD family protein [Vitreimonas sp.]HYD89575.1 CopD family protein [Vitreimonas sp.]
MEHVIGYDLARGLHIIAVIAWIAGLLMLPRFYAYITASQPGGELEAAMQKAARNLRVIILTPSFVLAWAFGIFLFVTYIAGDWDRPIGDLLATVPHWFWAKLILVLGLSGYQGFLSAEGRRLLKGERRHSERYWRLLSEVPFLVAIAAVLLATLEP